MKRYTYLIYIVAALLTALTAQPAMAQNEQNALYIYRNDGQFNAFFFGDIDHFEYSCIDTLGVEHDEYVVQEIHALDSVYRIPLTAIDSVSFITPETKYKADVFRPDKSIANYITASDSVYWIRLSANTPSALIPKVGDKLLIEEESPLIPDGFGGLVTSVDKNGSGYTVMTGPLELTDIYDQLVIKAAGASPGMENASTAAARRRGILDGYDISITPEEEINLPTISNTINLKRTHAFLADNSPLQINGDLQGSWSSTVSIKLKLRAFLTITPFTGFNYYEENEFDIESENATNVTGGFSARLELPFVPNPNPKWAFKLKGLNFDVGAGVFFEGSATAMSFTKKTSKHEKLYTTRSLDHKSLIVLPPLVYPNFFFRYHSDVLRDTTDWTFESKGSFSIGMGLYAKAETRFAIPVEKLPKFISNRINTDSIKGFKAGIGVDLGAKIDYQGPVWRYTPATNSKELLQTPPQYTELRQSKLALTGYLKGFGVLQFMKWSADMSPEFDFYKSNEYSLTPEFFNLKWHDEEFEPYRFTIMSNLRNNVLLPVDAGFTVFDKNDNQVDSWWGYYWNNKDLTKSLDHVFETLDPAKDEGSVYTIFPQVKFMGATLLGDQLAEIPVGKAKIDIGQHNISTNEERNHTTIKFVPNMKQVTLTPSASWLSTIRWDEKGTLDIYWEGLPEKESDRRGAIYVTGKTHKGQVLIEDSIVVVQAKASLELSTNKLTFDKKGGTKTVTITKTNLTDITVSTPSGFLRCAISGNIITVAVEPNNAEERSATIYIDGKLPTGAEGHGFIDVYQEGTSGNDPGPQYGDNVALKSLRFWVDVKKKTTKSDGEGGTWINGGPDSDFIGLYIDEEDWSNQKYALTSTENGNLLHISVQGKDTFESYDEDEYDVTSWEAKADLQFDLEKYKDGNKTKFRIINVKYKEEATNLSLGEPYAESKSGEISLNVPRTDILYNGIEAMTPMEVTDFKFRWDYKYPNNLGEISEHHYEWGYVENKDWETIRFKIEFADLEKFNEWIK